MIASSSCRNRNQKIERMSGSGRALAADTMRKDKRRCDSKLMSCDSKMVKGRGKVGGGKVR